MAFISIIAIIGIVLVTGGLIAFIGNMIVNAFDVDKRNSSDSSTFENKNVMTYEEYKRLEQTKQTEKVEEKVKEEEYDFDAIAEAKAQSEKSLIDEQEERDIYSFVEEQDKDLDEIENRLKADAEIKKDAEVSQLPADEDIDELDLDNLLSEISNEIIDEEKETAQKESSIEMSEELKQYNIDNIFKDETEDVAEMSDVEQIVEEVSSDKPVEEIATAEVVPQEEIAQAEEDVLPEEVSPEEEVSPVEAVEVKEKDNSQEIIASLKAQLADLNNQLEQARNNKIEVVTINMTEEECVARLELLEERLKNVKKEYKTNLKEYKPLRKVMNDLEKYQTKLRRKETKVANMKVSLYGVNNYVDLDKEKAEKLSNELELLDGLRFSVQHCEEVIANNKDRYPVLERTNDILEEQIEHIESDIASTQATLAKIREQNGDGENNGESGEGSQE